MTNFDRFLPYPQFTTFAPAAVAAEKILHIDLAACMLNCRRAMECGVKWMYSVDSALVKPFQDNLMNTGEFREIVGLDVRAAKEAFSQYLTNTSLDGRQIYFVNQNVEYIVLNGMMKGRSVFQELPFTD